MRDGRMHQTTVRFGPDLWEALEAECARLGVSAAQYVREAALARLAFTAGRLGGEDYARALMSAGAPAVAGAAAAESGAAGFPAPFGAPVEPHGAHAQHTIEESGEQQLASTALAAQNALALHRAAEIRAQSRHIRASLRREVPR